MKTAIFVGRFQPFHKGHEFTIKPLFKKFDKIIIVIGSTNKKNKENPFSFNERRRMINKVFSNYRNRYKIIGMPDIGIDKKWAKSIMKKARFDAVVTGNSWTKRCFKKFGIEVIKPRFIKPKTYNASRIRKLIRKNKNWEKLVPKGVVKIIKKSLS